MIQQQINQLRQSMRKFEMENQVLKEERNTFVQKIGKLEQSAKSQEKMITYLQSSVQKGESVRKDREINAYYSMDAQVPRRGSSESRNRSGKEKSMRRENSAYMDSGTADDKENLFSLSSTYPDRTVKKLSPTKETISAQNFDFNQVQTMSQQSHKNYLSMPGACSNLI